MTLRDRILPISDLVDAELARIVAEGESVPDLHDGMAYAMGLDTSDRKIRGKRLRPVLCIAAAEALGAPAGRALPFACAIELLHNFALVHDDLEDGDTKRRGRDTVWAKYGPPHGINIGDFLFAKVWRAILKDRANTFEVRERLMLLLSDTLEELFAGQALDISARAGTDFSIAQYERLVACKTGSYLAAPMLGGATVAGASEAVHAALRRCGAALGPLFQIKDDLIDLSSEKGRLAVGNDIREGKRSYLVAVVSERGSAAAKARLFAILGKPRDATAESDIADALAIFAECRAAESAEARCAELHAEALAAIAPLPDALRAVMAEAAEILLERKS